MSCASNEALIALHVEGDLPQRDVPSLEAHLLSCERCATFRDDLRGSQATLKSLGRAELPEASLDRIRRHTVAAVGGQPLSRGPLLAPAWALAGGVALAAAAGLWSASTPRPPHATVRATTAVAPGPRAESPRLSDPRASNDPQPPQASVAPRGSTIGATAPVSSDKGERVAEPSTMLSPEDADQLARAVVEVARVERLAASDTGDGHAEPDSLLVRLDTDDPDVVIYWQVDSNGG